MKKLILLIVLFVSLGVCTLLAQTTLVTGTVTSSIQGEGAIPGVTVTVKGTTLGALTDVNGSRNWWTIGGEYNNGILCCRFE
jgi:hypothetical protein